MVHKTGDRGGGAKSVAIVGLGRIGSRIAEQLVLDSVCDEILLWNRSLEKTKGFVDSLGMLGEIAARRVVVESFKWEKLDRVDLVVVAIKENYDPRDLLNDPSLPSWIPQDLRYVGLRADIMELYSLARQLRGYGGRILVITNPVDLVSSLISIWLPSAEIVGSGLTLDEARLGAFMARELGGVAEDYQVVLGGEHGPTAIPLRSRWQGRSIEVYPEEPRRVEQLVKKTHEFGYKVVGELGYTLHDAAYVFSRDIQWLLRDSVGFRSFSIWSGGACIGRPVGLDPTGDGFDKASLNPEEEKEISEGLGRLIKLVRRTKDEWDELF